MPPQLKVNDIPALHRPHPTQNAPMDSLGVFVAGVRRGVFLAAAPPTNFLLGLDGVCLVRAMAPRWPLTPSQRRARSCRVVSRRGDPSIPGHCCTLARTTVPHHPCCTLSHTTTPHHPCCTLSHPLPHHPCLHHRTASSTTNRIERLHTSPQNGYYYSLNVTNRTNAINGSATFPRILLDKTSYANHFSFIQR